MIYPPNRRNFVRNMLYRLKRDFGTPADVYRTTDETVDFATGEMATTTEKYSIKQAIRLPNKISDIVYRNATHRNFRYGGYLEVGECVLIIDRRDLPIEIINETCYIVMSNRRYEIDTTTEYEDKAAYILTLKETKGVYIGQTAEVALRDKIAVDEVNDVEP